MKLIVLAGLVSVEKIDLTLELARHFEGQRVAILDNVARLRIDPVHLGGETLIRREGDILPELETLLSRLDAEIVLFAVSETVSPAALFEALSEIDGIEIVTLALIDTRTCDCFPNVREELEANANLIVNLPYNIKEVIERVTIL